MVETRIPRPQPWQGLSQPDWRVGVVGGIPIDFIVLTFNADNKVVRPPAGFAWANQMSIGDVLRYCRAHPPLRVVRIDGDGGLPPGFRQG